MSMARSAIRRILAALIALGLFQAGPIPVRSAWAAQCVAGPLPIQAQPAAWFPENALLAWQAGRSFLLAGRSSEALCFFDHARLRLGDVAQLDLDLGDAYAQNGDLEQAMARWRSAADLGGEPESVLLRLLPVYESRQQWAELADALTRWIAIHPQDSRARYRLALLQATRDPASAADELNALASQHGESWSQAQDLAAILSTALEQGGEAYALARVGEFLLRVGEPRLAQPALQAALDRNPGYGEALAYLGLAREQAGQPAAADYAQAVVLSPDSPQAHLLYGSFLSRQGDVANARLQLDRAWVLDSHSWAIAVERGRLEFSAGELSAAETWYAQAVQVAPDSEEAWLARAAFYIGNQIRVNRDGIASAREALARAPSDPRALDLLGLAWYLEGDLPLAERMFWRALSVEPAYAAGYLHLGMLAESRGDRAAARAYYEAALHLAQSQPLGDEAHAALARLP